MNDTKILAWVPALFIVVGLGPGTWILPPSIGYMLSGGFLLLLLAYSLVDQEIGVESVHMIVITLLSIYWIGLVLQFTLMGMTGFLPYIVLTPLVIVSCVIVAPRLVHLDPPRYAAAVVSITSALTLLGFGLLYLSHTTGMSFPFTGRRVLGRYPLRIASIANNSNRYGALALIGFLTAIYLRTETRQERWTIATVLLLIGIVFSNNRTALVAASVGAFVYLVGWSPYTATTIVAGSTGLVLAIFALPVEFYEEANRSLQDRFDSWEIVLTETMADPLIGDAFQATIIVHNSYLGILLHAGLFFGMIYLLALVVAFGYALIKAFRGSSWDIYVFATLIAISIRITTDSSNIGGLSAMSLLLALYVGLAAYPPRGLRYTPRLYRDYQRYDRSTADK